MFMSREILAELYVTKLDEKREEVLMVLPYKVWHKALEVVLLIEAYIIVPR
jgi:hypothetical protein